jgi:hypothetical protein
MSMPESGRYASAEIAQKLYQETGVLAPRYVHVNYGGHTEYVYLYDFVTLLDRICQFCTLRHAFNVIATRVSEGMTYEDAAATMLLDISLKAILNV